MSNSASQTRMQNEGVHRTDKQAKLEKHKAELAEKIAKCLGCDVVCEL